MRKARRNINAKIEYAELTAQRRPRRERDRPPAPSDPEAADCSQHDGFAWQVYLMRGMMAFHPQEVRATAAERLIIRLLFWKIHARRKK